MVGETEADADDARPFYDLPLVGREEELGLLERAWTHAKAARGQVGLIQGDAGVGKSRLIDALRGAVGDEPHLWVTIRCSPYHANSPLHPLIKHLRRVLRWSSDDDDATRLAKLEAALGRQSQPLGEIVPLVGTLLSLPLPEDRYPKLTLEPKQLREQIQDAVLGWLLDEAERSPVLIVWEDLHWADPTTLELVGLFIDQSPTVAILNLLTYRPEFVPPWPTRSHVTPLTLNRLERPEVKVLIGHLAKGKSLPDAVTEHIVDKADGVPLYVEELTKTLLEQPILVERDDAYVLNGPLSDLEIPATLQDSLMARLDRAPSLRQVAQVGAVIGREFAYEMVNALSAMREAELGAALGQLVENELLYQRGRPPRARYIFKHALIQDAAYHSLLNRTRQSYHLELAKLIESRFPAIAQGSPELVAYHYTEGGAAHEAVAHWQLGGQLALARSAATEAVHHFSTAVALVEGSPEVNPATLLGLQLPLAGAYSMQLGLGAPETGAAFERARELCSEVGRTPELAPALFGLWRYFVVRPAFDTCQSLCEELLALPGDDDPTLSVLGHYGLGFVCYNRGEFERACEHFDAALAQYNVKQRRHAYGAGQDSAVSCLSYRAWERWTSGYPERAKDDVGRAIELAQTIEHPFTLAFVHVVTGLLHVLLRDIEGVRTSAAEALSVCAQHGFPPWRGWATALSGYACALTGDFEAGVEAIEAGFHEWRESAGHLMSPCFHLMLARAHLTHGAPEPAVRVLDAALEHSRHTGEASHLPEVIRLRGDALAAIEPQPGGQDCYRQAIEIAQRQGARSWELRATMSLAGELRDRGESQQAYARLEPILAAFTEGFDTADLADASELLKSLT